MHMHIDDPPLEVCNDCRRDDWSSDNQLRSTTVVSDKRDSERDI